MGCGLCRMVITGQSGLQYNNDKRKGEFEMFEKIQEIIADGLGVDKEAVTMGASFKEDLQADSLDLFEMVMSLEEEFGVEIPSEDLEKIVTVGDVMKYIEAK